jgi:hypothetical protein
MSKRDGKLWRCREREKREGAKEDAKKKLIRKTSRHFFAPSRSLVCIRKLQIGDVHFGAALADERAQLMGTDGRWGFYRNHAAAARAGMKVAWLRSSWRWLIKGRAFADLGDIGFTIHRQISQAVGGFIFVPEIVLDFGVIELMQEELGFVVEFFEIRIFDAIFAAHLFDD